MMVNKLSLSTVHGIIASSNTWQKLWNKQYEEDTVMGQYIYYDEKNSALNAFIDLVSAYFKENNYFE